MGWYGYEKWKYRKHSLSIEESVQRGVFVKKLNYKIENFNGQTFPFEVFIEKGFRWGHHSSEETVLVKDSNFPFQMSFPYRPTKAIGILISIDQLTKFDSSGFSLQNPQLPDTIMLKIEGSNTGIIKVW